MELVIHARFGICLLKALWNTLASILFPDSRVGGGKEGMHSVPIFKKVILAGEEQRECILSPFSR